MPAWAGRAARIAVSLGLLALAVWLLDWESLKGAFANLDWTVAALATLLLLAEFPVLGYRWYLLIKDEAPLRPYELVRRYFLAIFFNNFTPAQLGGDVYRFVTLKQQGVGAGRLVSRLLQERVIGLAGFLLFYLGCLAIAHGTGIVAISAATAPVYLFGLAAAGGLAGIALGRPIMALLARLNARLNLPLIGKVIEIGHDAFDFPRGQRLAAIMGLSVFGGCMIWIGAIAVVAADLKAAVPFVVLGMVGILVDIIRLVPITVQGLGVREAAFAYLFAVFGHGAEQGFVVGTVAYAAVSLSTVLIGGIGWLMPKGEVLESTAPAA